MTPLAAAYPPAIVLGAALLTWLLPRRIGHTVGMLATASVVGIAWQIPPGTYLGPVELFGVFEVVFFNVDAFSRLMALIFGIIGTGAVAYSWASEATPTQTAYALSYVGVSLGAVLAGDWLVLVIYWELMAVTSTLLVWHYGSRSAIRAGYRYAIFHGIGGSLLLAAVIWQFVATGSVLFSATEGIVDGTVPTLLAVLGIGVNVGFIGLHTWLPDTYPRPHIAASVFLCAFTTKTGVYTLHRAFPGEVIVIAYMGGAMAIFGAYTALLQSDMRRLLSYHIQSQVGYMVAGIGMTGAVTSITGADLAAGDLAVAGAFGHVFNNVLYKALLFMTVGVIIYRTGKESLDDIGGLGRKMPVTAVTFTIAALAISGIPGFNGFVSKGMVVDAAGYIGGNYEVLWWMLMIGSVGTVLSYVKLGWFAFVEGEYTGSVKDANRGQSVAMIGVAGLCLVYGMWPSALYVFLPAIDVTAVSAVPFERAAVWEAYTAYTVGHLIEAASITAVGLVGFLLLRGPLHHIGHVPDIDWLLNRGVFYGGRATVVAVTEVFGAVDRGVRWVTRQSIAVGVDPVGQLRTLRGAGSILGRRAGYAYPLRAGIGVSTAVLLLVTTLFLLAALLF